MFFQLLFLNWIYRIFKKSAYLLLKLNEMIKSAFIELVSEINWIKC